VSDPGPMSDEPEVSDAEVLSHLTHVAHRVALAIAAELPEGERAAAARAAETVLLSDEGARELLSAAYAEGRADALRGVVASGKAPASRDFSDVESLGERRLIVREDGACSTCSAADVCSIAGAVRGVEALVEIRRCDKHR
jgi:hypothetical protein